MQDLLLLAPKLIGAKVQVINQNTAFRNAYGVIVSMDAKSLPYNVAIDKSTLLLKAEEAAKVSEKIYIAAFHSSELRIV